MRTGNTSQHVLTGRSPIFLVGAFIIAAALLAVPSYSERSSPPSAGDSSEVSARSSHSNIVPAFSTYLMPLPVPQQSPEAIYTYAEDCSTPKSDFNLGETVCAKANGVPASLFPWRVSFVDPEGFIRRSYDASPDDNATYIFEIPSTQTSVINGQTVDNRGTWRANLTRSNGQLRQTALFRVHEPANPSTDVYVQKFGRNPDQTVQSGGSVAFIIIVGNNGPDTALVVHLQDFVPSGSTLTSFSQQSGPDCVPNGTGDCAMASLNSDEKAEFTAVYDTQASTPGTYTTAATVSSATADPDTSNNTSTATFEIASSGGGSQCTLICPTSPDPVNNDPGMNGATVDWDGPNNDNVPIADGDCGSVSTSQPSPHFFSIGVTPITVTTESGEECTFTVTVIDNENPNIGNCPANMTVPEDSGTPGSAVVEYNPPSATDNSQEVTVTCDPPPGSSFTVSGSPHTVTCTAADNSGNTDTCTFTVTVTSNTGNCTLTPPADITATSDANACGTNVTYQNPTQNGTDCGTVTCDRASGSFFPVGTTVVTCNDTSGASTNFNVTVNDGTGPVPNVDPLPTAHGQCRVTVNAPTATDNCSGQISGTTQDPTTYDTPGTYTVHWTYTDANGNTTNQNQTVIVDPDTSPPVITACAANRTITADSSCAVMPDMTGEVTATDNCTTVEVTQSPAAGTTLGSGNTTVTFTVTDNAGNSATCTATVTVVDNTPPTVTAPADSSASADANCQAPVPDYAAASTAADNCDTSVTVTQSPAVGAMVGPGSHTVTVTATDDAGNSSSDTVVFTVNDTTAPTVIAPDDSSASADASCRAPVPDYAAASTAADNCDTSVTVTQSPAAGTMVGAGPHTVTVTATDDAGNSGTDTVVFTVNDTTAPTVTAPADSSADADANCQAPVPNYAANSTAADNCDTSVTVTQSPAAGTMVGAGSHTVTVTATDDAGNSSSDTVVFTVNDTTPPTISCPANITVYLPMNSTATSTTVTYTAPTGTDNCSGATTTQTAGLPSGASFPVGTTTNTFTVTDGSNNSASCSFTVTVLYNFSGFFSPVSNPPTVNNVNAGRHIPLKFSLSGNKGLDIFAAGYPASLQVACDSSAPLSELEGLDSNGGSTLTYSPDTYHYNWKTDSSWAGTCRKLVVKLNDGSEHIALFKFK